MSRISRVWNFVTRLDRSLLVAGALSLFCFGYVGLDYYRHGLLQTAPIWRSSAVMLLVFVLLSGIFRVMDADIAAEVKRLSEDPPMQDPAVFVFVIVKALIRMFAGVTIVLLWLAGLLSILDRQLALGFYVALAFGCVYSLFMLAVAIRIVAFIDGVGHPRHGRD